MYKVSVTTLEAFRRYLDEVSFFDTEQSLIRTIKGEFKGNAKTVTGSAFHKLIENPYHSSICTTVYGGDKYVVVDNIAFPHAVAMAGYKFYKEHQGMVYEVPVKMVYNTEYGQVLVNGRIDGVMGKQVEDNKTKYRKMVDATAYMDSCQWKYYLDMIGCSEFRYNVFEMKNFIDFDMDTASIVYQHELEVELHEPIVCHRYIGMHHDCCSLLDKFMQFIYAKGLQSILKQADPVTLQTIKNNIQYVN